MSLHDEPPPMSREWHYHPDLPVGFAPFFSWPPQPRRVAAFLWEYYLQTSDRSSFVLLAFATFYLFQSAPADMATLGAGWVLAALARNYVLMLVVAGGLHLWFYGYKKQGKRLKFDPRELSRSNQLYKFGDQVRDNMFYTLASGVPIWTAYEVLLTWAYASGIIPTFEFSDGWLWFIAAFPVLAIYQSFHFYCIHRLLHWPPLYTRFHSVHHRNVNVGPWSGFSMHPFEHGLYLSAILIHFILPTHPVHMLFLMYWLALGASSSHSGYEGLWIKDKRRLLIGGFFHQLHHRYYECNYGNSEMPWDKWLGSYHDGSPEKTEETRARRKRMYAK